MKKCLLVILIIILSFSLFACDEREFINGYDTDIFVYSYEYEKSTDAVSVILTMNKVGDTKPIAVGKQKIYKSTGAYYDNYDYIVIVDKSIWGKVKNDSLNNERLKEDLKKNEVDNVYKIKMYFAFMTNYRLIIAEGKRSKINQLDVYTKLIEEGEAINFSFTRMIENGAVWYGTLIGFCAILTLILVLVVEKNNIKIKIQLKKEKKNE